jgi:hypothetical protein
MCLLELTKTPTLVLAIYIVLSRERLKAKVMQMRM